MTFLLHSVTFLLKRTPFSASYFSNVRSSSSKNLLKLFHRKELHWMSLSVMRWTATKILENLGCSSTFWHQKRFWHHHFEFDLMSVLKASCTTDFGGSEKNWCTPAPKWFRRAFRQDSPREETSWASSNLFQAFQALRPAGSWLDLDIRPIWHRQDSPNLTF